jgi:hypothetical protein
MAPLFEAHLQANIRMFWQAAALNMWLNANQ